MVVMSIRDMIMKDASTDALREEARAGGMLTLRDVGMVSCYCGMLFYRYMAEERQKKVVKNIFQRYSK